MSKVFLPNYIDHNITYLCSGTPVFSLSEALKATWIKEEDFTSLPSILSCTMEPLQDNSLRYHFTLSQNGVYVPSGEWSLTISVSSKLTLLVEENGSRPYTLPVRRISSWRSLLKNLSLPPQFILHQGGTALENLKALSLAPCLFGKDLPRVSHFKFFSECLNLMDLTKEKREEILRMSPKLLQIVPVIWPTALMIYQEASRRGDEEIEEMLEVYQRDFGGNIHDNSELCSYLGSCMAIRDTYDWGEVFRVWNTYKNQDRSPWTSIYPKLVLAKNTGVLERVKPSAGYLKQNGLFTADNISKGEVKVYISDTEPEDFQTGYLNLIIRPYRSIEEAAVDAALILDGAWVMGGTILCIRKKSEPENPYGLLALKSSDAVYYDKDASHSIPPTALQRISFIREAWQL